MEKRILHILGRQAALLGLALALSGCAKPLLLYFEEPEGPPDYVQGWHDGCDSGIGAGGGFFAKMMYSFKKDPEMISNSLYRQGWNEAQLYCRFYYSSWWDGK